VISSSSDAHASGSEEIVGQARLGHSNHLGGLMLRADPRPSEKYPENHQTHGGESENRPDKQ
jgi:hypothetical protein